MRASVMLGNRLEVGRLSSSPEAQSQSQSSSPGKQAMESQKLAKKLQELVQELRLTQRHTGKRRKERRKEKRPTQREFSSRGPKISSQELQICASGSHQCCQGHHPDLWHPYLGTARVKWLFQTDDQDSFSRRAASEVDWGPQKNIAAAAWKRVHFSGFKLCFCSFCPSALPTHSGMLPTKLLAGISLSQPGEEGQGSLGASWERSP